MHLLMMLSVLILAFGLRLIGHRSITLQSTWLQKWQRTLMQFLLPPLLLLMTAISILWMGRQGQMVGGDQGLASIVLALSILGTAVVTGLHCTYRVGQLQRQLHRYPLRQIYEQPSRYLETSAPFAAQVGFWNSVLVVSQGLLDILTPEQATAVLVHEQAHRHYRDTFWFFWLGWVYQWTRWLPRSEALWQELLMLRELRADDWAAQRVDRLLLAESLLMMVQSPLWIDLCAAFSPVMPRSRLEERIDALLSDPKEISSPNLQSWSWILWVLLPLLIIPFHY
ncbi:MAG: M56 family metallopeptidase [Thermosynechococcaceae cyanobacterium]